jgi:transcriptional regulator with XRE-family HTH domain
MAVDERAPSPFGVRLRHLRVAARLTQELLAERSGISVDAISTLESGRRQRPHPQTVLLLAVGLGLDADERDRLVLLAREGREHRPREAAVAGGAAAGPAVLPRWWRRLRGPATCTLLAIAVLLATGGPDHGCGLGLCGGLTTVSDGVLASDLSALQAASYVLDTVPDRYALGPLPATGSASAVAAQRLDDGVPYRVVIRVRDLRRSGTSLFIESVRLLLTEVESVRAPLRVWTVGPPPEEAGNPYLASYEGQRPGTALVARYAGRLPQAHVQLVPGETDRLAIAVTAAGPATIGFQVELTYRIASELRLRSLVVPSRFRVTFSDILNWQPYALQGGRLVPV